MLPVIASDSNEACSLRLYRVDGGYRAEIDYFSCGEVCSTEYFAFPYNSMPDSLVEFLCDYSHMKDWERPYYANCLLWESCEEEYEI